jgi:ribosomal-protein-alanine acetyltransferase
VTDLVRSAEQESLFRGLEIRPGRPDDVATLREIECTVFDLEQLTAPSFRRYMTLAGADLLVATRDGDLIGYGILSYRRGSARGRLISLAVATYGTGRGIGTALLLALHARARDRGMKTIRLEVRRDNLAAIRLYDRAGYAKIGEKPAYYADFCDAIVMEHRLAR